MSRIKGLPLLDTAGDQVGKVRDVVLQNRPGKRAPRVKGLVVELFALRRIFFPMVRVHSIDANQVIISGVVNTRRFEPRELENLAIDDLFDRTVYRRGNDQPFTIYDLAIRQVRPRDWELSEVALRDQARRRHVEEARVEIERQVGRTLGLPGRVVGAGPAAPGGRP